MELIPNAPIFKKSILFAVLALVVSCSSVKWSASEGDADQMMDDIAYLASNKLEGRTFGTRGETEAGNYISKRMRMLGLTPMGNEHTWFQTFSVDKPSPHGVDFADNGTKNAKSGRNVIGYLDHGAQYTVVLGAHYDHLGYGEFGSLHTGHPEIHNGADDNASGVALILEMAQRLQNEKKFNYLFIGFTGEENGLWGSNYFCKNPTFDLSKVTAMINFDMVGRLRDQKIAINGTGTSPVWPDVIERSNTFDFVITSEESGIGPSDYTSFYLVDIPAIHFFTGAHEDYHKPSDDVELINAPGMEVIADMVSKIIDELDSDSKLEFSRTKDPDPSTTPSMEVTLGVLPDYLYDGVGMRIDGVRDGKPAAVAGMQKGDVIIRFNGKEVNDIYVYMEVLGELHKGDKTKLVALRDGEEKQFEIQF